MPEQRTAAAARRDRREGKAPSTQAGEFIREQIHHIRQGRHGARSAKQAIAIGLSQARRAGVDLPPPKQGGAVRRKAERDREIGQGQRKPRSPSRRRSQAVSRALSRESRAAASHDALARQARQAARARTGEERSAAARKAARTKGLAARQRAAIKASRTRHRDA